MSGTPQPKTVSIEALCALEMECGKLELKLATERARAEHWREACGQQAIERDDFKVKAELAQARLADACFHLKCAGRLLLTAATDEDGADGDECLEQHRNIEAFLSSTNPPPILGELERLRAEVASLQTTALCKEGERLAKRFDEVWLELKAAEQERDALRAQLQVAKTAVQTNHRWHLNYNDEGYHMSDLYEQNVEALAQLGGEKAPVPNKGRLEGLRYALEIAQGRRVLNRPPAYLACVEEMEIFLKAAIERVEMGEGMNSVAICQSAEKETKP